MFRTIALLLPALFPSWRFFKTVGPSPRVLFQAGEGAWRDLLARPARLSMLDLCLSLFWNPRRNAQLYLVTCAERLVEEETDHALHVIKAAVRDAAQGRGPLRFRIVYLEETPLGIQEELAYESAPWEGS